MVSNKISKIENLDCCPKLNMLELGDNKIRKVGCFQYLPYFDYCFIFNLICFKVENLENLKELKELYLGILKWWEPNFHILHLCIHSGKNKITKMEGMDTLTYLKILSIQVWWALGLCGKID